MHRKFSNSKEVWMPLYERSSTLCIERFEDQEDWDLYAAEGVLYDAKSDYFECKCVRLCECKCEIGVRCQVPDWRPEKSEGREIVDLRSCKCLRQKTCGDAEQSQGTFGVWGSIRVWNWMIWDRSVFEADWCGFKLSLKGNDLDLKPLLRSLRLDVDRQLKKSRDKNWVFRRSVGRWGFGCWGIETEGFEVKYTRSILEIVIEPPRLEDRSLVDEWSREGRRFLKDWSRDWSRGRRPAENDLLKVEVLKLNLRGRESRIESAREFWRAIARGRQKTTYAKIWIRIWNSRMGDRELHWPMNLKGRGQNRSSNGLWCVEGQAEPRIGSDPEFDESRRLHQGLSPRWMYLRNCVKDLKTPIADGSKWIELDGLIDGSLVNSRVDASDVVWRWHRQLQERSVSCCWDFALLRLCCCRQARTLSISLWEEADVLRSTGKEPPERSRHDLRGFEDRRRQEMTSSCGWMSPRLSHRHKMIERMLDNRDIGRKMCGCKDAV